MFYYLVPNGHRRAACRRADELNRQAFRDQNVPDVLAADLQHPTEPPVIAFLVPIILSGHEHRTSVRSKGPD